MVFGKNIGLPLVEKKKKNDTSIEVVHRIAFLDTGHVKINVLAKWQNDYCLCDLFVSCGFSG